MVIPEGVDPLFAYTTARKESGRKDHDPNRPAWLPRPPGAMPWDPPGDDALIATCWLLITLLCAAPAQAGPAEIEALDQLLEAVQLAPGVDPTTNPQALADAVLALQALEAAVATLPDDQHDAGLLRLAEGYHGFAADLVAIPCPQGLDQEQCALFTGLLAERAQPLATRAAQGLAAIAHSTALSRGDRKRREALAAGLASLNQALFGAVSAMPRPQQPPPRPEPVAPRASSPGWTPPAGQPSAASRFAVIRGVGGLLRAPGDPVLLADPGDPASADQLYVVELLGRSDGLAELRLGGEVAWDQHCVPHQTLERWVTVRAWLPEDQLLEVVAAEVVEDHADGTGLRLLPGVPVVEGHAWLAGQLVPLPDGARTATDYGAGEPRLEIVHSSEQIPWTTTGQIGSEPFELRQPAYDHNDAMVVSSAVSRGGTSLIVLTERCGELRFTAPLTQPLVQATGVLGGLMGGMGPTDWTTLRPGTKVYWINGQPAGQVLTEFTVLSSELRGAAMRCLEPKLGSAEGWKVPLCFDPADLETP